MFNAPFGISSVTMRIGSDTVTLQRFFQQFDTLKINPFSRERTAAYSVELNQSRMFEFFHDLRLPQKILRVHHPLLELFNRDLVRSIPLPFVDASELALSAGSSMSISFDLLHPEYR